MVTNLLVVPGGGRVVLVGVTASVGAACLRLADYVKHVNQRRMATMTVRDVRLKWPQAERILAQDGEIIVTRDSRPVARILPYRSPQSPPRRRFDPQQHATWLRRFWKSQPAQPLTDDLLRNDRDE